MNRGYSGLLLLVSVLLCVASAARGDEGVVAHTKLEGAWRKVQYKPGGAGEYVRMPEGWEQTKLVVGGRFAWSLVKDGKVVSSAGGKIAIRDDQYTEQIEYVRDEDHEWMLGKTGTFKATLEGDKWYHDGVIRTESGDVKVTEIWERIE